MVVLYYHWCEQALEQACHLLPFKSGLVSTDNTSAINCTGYIIYSHFFTWEHIYYFRLMTTEG